MGREKFPTAKREQRERERETGENRINIRDNIDLQERGVALVPLPPKKRKKEKRKRWYPFDRVSPRNAKPCPLYKYNN